MISLLGFRSQKPSMKNNFSSSYGGLLIVFHSASELKIVGQKFSRNACCSSRREGMRDQSSTFATNRTQRETLNNMAPKYLFLSILVKPLAIAMLRMGTRGKSPPDAGLESSHLDHLHPNVKVPLRRSLVPQREEQVERPVVDTDRLAVELPARAGL